MTHCRSGQTLDAGNYHTLKDNCIEDHSITITHTRKLPCMLRYSKIRFKVSVRQSQKPFPGRASKPETVSRKGFKVRNRLQKRRQRQKQFSERASKLETVYRKDVKARNSFQKGRQSKTPLQGRAEKQGTVSRKKAKNLPKKDEQQGKEYYCKAKRSFPIDQATQ